MLVTIVPLLLIPGNQFCLDVLMGTSATVSTNDPPISYYYMILKFMVRYISILTDLATLIMFYKQRPDKETSWQMSSFDSRCLTVAYFWLKI